MTMFNSIVDATRKAKETHPELEFLIPTGTAIQNLRTSFIGDNLTRDGAHLTEDLGRHANAYTWLAVLFGKERLCQNTYVPFNLTEYTSMMARNAALSAIENPYIITPQNYPDYAGDNTIVPADILFNFSFEGTFTEGWNDVMLHHVLTAGHKDTKGKDSGIVIQCDSSFTNANFAGVLETNALLEMPSDVSQTALWGYSEGNFNDFPQVPTVTLYFKHLNKSLVYDFTFFSSRASTTDNRETQFTLVGQETKTATLDASNNKSKTVTVSDIQPDEEGTIALTVQAGPNNNNFYKFYYLNALRISAHELDFALTGDEQPKAGESLSVSSNGDLSGYAFKWTRGDALGTFDDASVLSSTKDYVITENDYEHWLRVSVCDNAGNTVFTKDTWISKLPVLYIDTEDGNQITSKDFYVTANLRIQGNAEFEQQYLGITEIKGRGSSSWNTYPQKPYKLKLDKKTKLFGFGKSKHWVLISNFNDKCSLRNYTASRLAKELGIIGMEMTWVDVVLNGEAKGCYMLSQHVRVDKNCVDIFDWEGEAEDVADALFAAVKDADALAETDQELLEEKMEKNLTWVTDGRVNFKGKTYNLSDYGLKKEYDITKGYLLEIAQKIYGHSHYMTPQGVNFEVSAPEYLSTNREMFSYVKDLWDNFEAEYCRVPTIEGKNFSKYADMQSMVGIWFVNEILAQGDLNNSRYCYIPDDGKIHFGPAWDFDHAAASWTTSRKTVCFYTSLAENKYLVFKKWFPDPVLCQMAYDTYWNVARPFMMDLLSEGGEMDTRYIYIAEADKTNDTLWGSYPSLLNPNAIARTAAEDYQILRTFLADHINWLDEQFQSVITLIEAMNKVFMYPCSQEIIDGIQNLESNRRTGVQKIIHDKHLYIIRDGETYSVDGKRIK